LILAENWRRVSANTASAPIEVTAGTELKSIQEDAMNMYFKAFEHKEFTRGSAQGLPSFVQDNAYKTEEAKFLRTVRMIPPSKIPKGANVITSHVIYKVKQSDDGDLFLKARIAPHGNKDREKSGLKTDSATCPPVVEHSQN